MHVCLWQEQRTNGCTDFRYRALWVFKCPIPLLSLQSSEPAIYSDYGFDFSILKITSLSTTEQEMRKRPEALNPFPRVNVP